MFNGNLLLGLFLTKRFCAEDKENSTFYDRSGLALAVATQEATDKDSSAFCP